MSVLGWILLGIAGCGLVWLATAGATLWLAHRRGGSPGRWTVYGLLLGPVGIVLALRHVRPCPGCGATVLNEVRVCPACGHDIPRRDPADNPVGPLWSYRKDW